MRHLADLRAQILDGVANTAERLPAPPFVPGGRRCRSPARSSTPPKCAPWWTPRSISGSPPAASPISSSANLPAGSAAAFCLLVNSGSSANLLALSCLTSPRAGRAPAGARRRSDHRGRRLPHDGQPDPAERPGAGLRRRDRADVQRRRDASSKPPFSPRTRAIMVAHTLGNPFDLDAVTEFVRRARPVADRGLLRRRRRDLWRASRSARSATWPPCSFYPAHHITMGEGGGVLTDRPLLKTLVESFRDWGRDCWCAPGKDNTCGKRFDWQLGELAARLRPQVHLLAHRLQPEGDRHAGGRRRGPAGEAARLHRGPPAQFRSDCYDGLRDLEEFFILPEPTRGSEPSWFGFPIGGPARGARSRATSWCAHLESAARSPRACCSAAT